MIKPKSSNRIVAAVQCRIAELRRLRPTTQRRAAIQELENLLEWIRTGQVKLYTPNH